MELIESKPSHTLSPKKMREPLFWGTMVTSWKQWSLCRSVRGSLRLFHAAPRRTSRGIARHRWSPSFWRRLQVFQSRLSGMDLSDADGVKFESIHSDTHTKPYMPICIQSHTYIQINMYTQYIRIHVHIFSTEVKLKGTVMEKRLPKCFHSFWTGHHNNGRQALPGKSYVCNLVSYLYTCIAKPSSFT